MLPTALQNAIFAEKTADAIRKACVLRETDGNTSLVAKLTGRVLLGYLRPEIFAQEIQKETGMEELQAQHVAHDIDIEIFSEVRLELKKLYPPTLQTPNVQVQGFSPAKISGGNLGGQALPAKPKYVIPIPEKFQGRPFPGMAAQQKQGSPVIPVAQAPSAPAPEPVKPVVAAQPPLQPVPAASIKQEVKIPEIKIPPTAPAPAVMQQPVAEKKPADSVMPPIPEKKSEQPPQSPAPSAPPLPPKQEEKKSQPSAKIAQTVEPSGIKMNPVVPLPTFIGSRFQQKTAESDAGKSAEETAKDSQQKIKELAAKFSSSSTAQQKPQQESAYKEKVDAPKKPATVDLSKF